MTAKKFTTVEEYMLSLPEDMRNNLEKLRGIIRQAAPHAREVISYNMPAIRQHGVLVYYAANKGHIGFYPTASPIVVFKDRLSSYKTSKGAIQFPADEEIPAELVTLIVKFRVEEDNEKDLSKQKRQ